MDIREKRRLAQNAVYILTAAVIVILMCMTLITSVMNQNKREDEEDIPHPEDMNYAVDYIDGVKADNSAEDDITLSGEEIGGTTSLTEDENNIIEEEAEDVMGDSAEDTESSVNTDNNISEKYVPQKYVLPVKGVISRGYEGDIPVWSSTMDDYRTHTGIDISSSIGKAVVACADGKVTAVYDDPFYGVTVVIDHGEGLISRCSGLSYETLEYLENGEKVYAGDIIGAVGDSSGVEMADEPHVHLSMSLNSVPVNPLSYIPYNESDAVIVYEDE